MKARSTPYKVGMGACPVHGENELCGCLSFGFVTVVCSGPIGGVQ
jgi:hypothetical protein